MIPIARGVAQTDIYIIGLKQSYYWFSSLNACCVYLAFYVWSIIFIANFYLCHVRCSLGLTSYMLNSPCANIFRCYESTCTMTLFPCVLVYLNARECVLYIVNAHFYVASHLLQVNWLVVVGSSCSCTVACTRAYSCRPNDATPQ